MKLHTTLPLFCLLVMLWSALAAAAPISVALEHENAIGLSTSYLKEQGSRLDLKDAVASYQEGKFRPGENQVLNFGIGSKPVWVHFAVDNPTETPREKRLSIETSWLDSIEVYIEHQGNIVARHHLGDSKPFAQRPINSRYFALDQKFDTGVSNVFLRIETPDPMVIPIYLMNMDEARIREVRQEHSYGIVYGFLFALLAYNAMLFAGLRSWRFLFYSLYLTMFVAMNFTYTGHAYAWIWPTAVKWQLWSHPVLIFFYGASGLLFALLFLDTREHFPRVHKTVIGLGAVFGTLLTAAIVADSQLYALLVSFTFVFLFANIMLFLGVISVYSGQKPARYFLLASIAAMAGAMLTTLSTWGFIPHNSWTFRAVEIGMLADATLLALALAFQFRVIQEERIRAEELAQLDPLTGLNNRRAFYDKTASLWSAALRNQRNTSVMLMDIDLFKNINDAHGHAHGDQVLVAIAEKLKNSIRQCDVLARWGGEEFIVFMPETDPREATMLAERLRAEIAKIRVAHATGETTVQASFGVARRRSGHITLDSLIASADNFLYQSKQQGRNRITSDAENDGGTLDS